MLAASGMDDLQQHQLRDRPHPNAGAVSDASPKKACFVVADEADGRRYKVFLRPCDFPKLKMAKVRKTVSSAAKLSPEDFALLLNGVELDDGVTGAQIGLGDSTVLVLRRHSTAEPSDRGDSAAGAAGRVAEKAPSTVPSESCASSSPLKYRARRAATNAVSPPGMVRENPGHGRGAGPPSARSQSPSAAATPALPFSLSFAARAGGTAPVAPVAAPATSPLVHEFVEASVTHALGAAHNAREQPRERNTSTSRSASRSGSVALTERQIRLQEALLHEAREQRLLDDPHGTADGGAGALQLDDLLEAVESGQETEGATPPGRFMGGSNASAVLLSGRRAVPMSPRFEKITVEAPSPPPRSVAVPERRRAEADARSVQSPELLRTETSDWRIPARSRTGGPSLESIGSNAAWVAPLRATANTTTAKDADGADDVAAVHQDELRARWRDEVRAVQKKWQEERRVWEAEVESLTRQLRAAGSGAGAQRSNPLLDEIEWADVQDTLAALHTVNSEKQVLAKEVGDLRQRLAEAEKHRELEKDSAAAAEKALMAIKGAVAERLGPVHGGGTSDSVERMLHMCVDSLVSQRQLQRLEADNKALRAQLGLEAAKRRGLHCTLEELKGNIRVIARLRPPLTSSQLTAGRDAHNDATTIALEEARNAVSLACPSTGTRKFEFYRVLGPDAEQRAVFAEVAPLVQTALDGHNVAILAYGQTGSGKTHTIIGASGSQGPAALATARHDICTDGEKGVLPRAIEELFSELEAMPPQSVVFSVHCSMVELYNDQLRDLLAPNAITGNKGGKEGSGSRCDVKFVNGVSRIVGVTEHAVRTTADALALLHCGTEAREVHATKQNTHSSRSHAIFSVHMLLRDSHAGTERRSKLVFVDLAGSERVSKSQSVGERLREAQFINKSLSALGDVVFALSKQQADESSQHAAAAAEASGTHVGFQLAAQQAPFVPYRNSKLTLLLQDCIGGSAKAVLIACLAPNCPPIEMNTAETLSTLQFASRVRRVRNGVGCRLLASHTTAPAEARHMDPSSGDDGESEVQQRGRDRTAFAGVHTSGTPRSASATVAGIRRGQSPRSGLLATPARRMRF